MAVKASAAITLSSIRDLQSCTRYYLLQSSTSAKPSKPTANPPGGNWVTAEPTYTSGSTNSLYFCDLNVFSDGSFAYSDVSLSSSYEAAKAAYNKAATAQATAQQALSNTEVIVGTQTASTGAWTGVASFSELKDGQQIVYWLPYAGSGNATLNLTLANGTTTGAKNCYYSGTTRLTTHYAAGNEAQVAASTAQATADAARADFRRVVRIDNDGLHVGDNQSTGEVLIDSESVNVVMNGSKYSRFAGNYVQFGNYQLRRTTDGGLAFKMTDI